MAIEDAAEPAALLISKLDISESVDIRWPGRYLTSSFPQLGRIQFLCCKKAKDSDWSPPSLIGWRVQSDRLFIPREDFFNNHLHKLVNVRMLALDKIPSDYFKWPAFFRSLLTEECHLDAHLFDITLLYTLERLQRPLFPNLNVLTLWEARQHRLMGMRCLAGPGSPAQRWIENLQEKREVTQTRQNGTTYLVRLRKYEVHGEEDIFTFEGMSLYLKTKLGKHDRL